MDPDLSISKQIIREKLNFYCFVTLFDLLPLKTNENIPIVSNKQKNIVGVLKATDEKYRIRIHISVYESKDPDPFKNVTVRNIYYKYYCSFNTFFLLSRHKVLIYIEHHRVCPFVGIGTPPPL